MIPLAAEESVPGSLDALLLELIGALRLAGVRISTSEALDAQRTASLVGFSDRASLRAALAATVAKRGEERPIFERVFDAFFRVDGGGRRSVLDRLRAEGLSEPELARIATELGALALGARGAGSGGGAAPDEAILEGGPELDQRIEDALRAAGVPAIASVMQVGLFSLRASEALGLRTLEERLLARGAELDPRARQALSSQLEAIGRRIRARVREELQRRDPTRLARSRAGRLERTALVALDRTELADVRREVERLGRTLRDRVQRRRRRARRGRLDVRATMRAAHASSGIPLRLVRVRRRRDRPKLVVLADVSGSVKAASTFLLVLVHAMQDVFARTRSFVFVRDLVEVSDLFRGRRAEEAVALALDARVVDAGGSSDYGRVLEQLWALHRHAVDRRTTIVILGDARNNRLEPRTELLAALRARAARVVWLNPEPAPSWGFGDSEMEAYGAIATTVHEVGSLAQLRVAMARFVHDLGR